MPADAAPREGSPAFRVSTDDFPAAERAACWREEYGRRLFRLEFEPLGDLPFFADATVVSLPDVDIVRGASSPLRIARTRELLDDGEDRLILQLATVPLQVAQFGREVELAPNDAILMSNSDVGSITEPAAATIMALRLRRSPLAALVQSLDSAFMRPIPQRHPALRLLTGYLDLLAAGGPAIATPELQRAAASHIYDLLAIALGATRDAAAVGSLRGVRAARLQSIKMQIAEHLHRGDMPVAEVAAQHGITPRALQMLFEADGTTFSKFVLHQRLDRVHRMLTDPECGERSITDAAFAAGFNDLSYFNRTFRRRFGATPSEVRAGAAAPPDG